MTDWLSHCLFLKTHESVWIFMSFQIGAIQNSTEQRVGTLKNARVNEGNTEFSFFSVITTILF